MVRAAARAARERPGQGVHLTQALQRVGGAGAAEDGAEQDEDAAHHGRGGETYHAAADGRAEHVGGVVGAKRPAEKQAAGQEQKDRDIHRPPRCSLKDSA